MSGDGSIPSAPSPGPFLILIDGLPPALTWKELKDMIRPVANTSIWTDIPVLLEPARHLKKGYVRLKLWKEALGAFKLLSSPGAFNWTLYVELHDIHASPPKFIHRNYKPESGNSASYLQDVARVIQNYAAWQPNLSPPGQPRKSSSYPPSAPAQYVAAPVATQTAPSYPMQSIASQNPYQQSTSAFYSQTNSINLQAQQAHAQQMQYQQALALCQGPTQQQHINQSQVYPSRGAIPVNTSGGIVRTESRSVFVNNISYKTTKPELIALFEKFGKIVESGIETKYNGELKGHATVQYATVQEATKAVKGLNGFAQMGRQLTATFDKNKFAVSAPGPVIVNGSMGMGKASKKVTSSGA